MTAELTLIEQYKYKLNMLTLTTDGFIVIAVIIDLTITVYCAFSGNVVLNVEPLDLMPDIF